MFRHNALPSLKPLPCCRRKSTLREFLKEHKVLVEAQHKADRLETTVATVVATLKEQATQIQKVKTKLATASPSRGGLELNNPERQTVVNNQENCRR
jgi:hypothetical protein